MKRIVVNLFLIFSMVMCGGIFAQNNGAQENKSTEKSVLSKNTDTTDVKEWSNLFERFIGVWSLEETIVNDEGIERKIHPGTFMVVHPNASYTIFIHCDLGAVITSQGNIIIESSDQYIEVISRHVNNSLVGISNRIEYKLDPTSLYKSFWVEKDSKGDDFKKQVNEVWKRGTMPDIIFEK